MGYGLLRSPELADRAGVVQARHRHFQLSQQLCKANWHSLRVKTLGSIRCRPLALKLPIPKATVRWLLTWRPTALVAHRARR